MGNACGCTGKSKRKGKGKLNLQVVGETPSATHGGQPHSRNSLRGADASGRPDGATFEFEFPRDYRPEENDPELESFRQSMSFIKENNVNNFSFDLYGEDLSKVRKTYLLDLRNGKDLTVKMTRQELLLLSNDVPEILKFLKKRDIDVHSLAPYSTTALNEMMNVSNLKRKIAARDQLRYGEPVYPEDLRLKYAKMTERGTGTGKPKDPDVNDDSKFLNTTYDAGEFLEREAHDLLLRSSVLNKEGMLIPPWDADRFELCIEVDGENRGRNDLAEFDQILTNMAVELKVPYQPKTISLLEGRLTGRQLSQVGGPPRPSGVVAPLGSALPEVVGELKPIVDDLRYPQFADKKFFAVMSSIINYDQIFETNLIKRLIFPQKEGRAYPTHSGLHIIKLHINGCKRAFVTQCLDVFRYLTIRNEQYPCLLQSALRLIYPSLQAVCPTVVIFRLCNWIPEKMFVKDVGDVFTSYDKLKETFKAGNLILHWEDLTTGAVRPVLDFTTPDKTLKRYIRTTQESPDRSDTSFVLADWEDLFNHNRIGNLFINWNPTIYSHRKTLHGLYYGNLPYKGGFDTPNFKLQRTTQFLVTMYPHKEVCETRLVIEKHRSALNIPYKIKYFLFNFNKGRVVLPHGSIREVEVSETQEEILSDILIFDENSNYENYVIAVQLTVENEADLALIREDHFEIISVSLYTFADFDFIEIPHSVVEQLVSSSPSVSAMTPKDRMASVAPNPSGLVSPYYKLSVFQKDTFEVRVDTDVSMLSEIVVLNYENMRKSLSKVQTPLVSSENVLGSNSLMVTLDEGVYAVRVSFSPAASSQTSNIIRHSIKTERFAQEQKRAAPIRPNGSENINILFLAFASKYAKGYEAKVRPAGSGFDVSPVSQKPGPGTVKMRVEQLSLQSSLGFKRVLKGAWSKTSNYGSAKAKVDCYQKFMKNPGFVIAPSAESEFKFRLSTPRSGSTSAFPYICIAVYEIRDDFTFSSILEDDDYVQAAEFQTDTIMLRPNRFGYLVLCLTLEPSYQAPFELEVQSEHDLTAFYDTRSGILQFPFKKELSGEVRAMTGGHITSPSFLFNTAFVLSFEEIRKDGSLFVELATQNATQNISVYLIPTNKSTLVELAEMDINNFDYNPAFLTQVNSIFRPLTAQRYLVIPSTLKMLAEPVPFELRVTSTCRFDLSRAHLPVFNDSYVIQQDDKFGRETRFVLREPDRVLIVVQPKVQNVKVQMVVEDVSIRKEVYHSFSQIQDGFVFKMLDLQDGGHQFRLQVATDRGVVSLIKLYGMKMGNLQIN